MRYFPLADPEHEVSLTQMRCISGVSQSVDDATTAATVQYLVALDKVHRALQDHHRAITARCSEMAAREAALVGQLERLRVHTDQVEVCSAIVLRDWRTDELYLRRKINDLYRNFGPSQKFTARKTRVTIPWTGQRVQQFGLPELDPTMAAKVQEYESAAEVATHDAFLVAQAAAAAEVSTDYDDVSDADISNAASAAGTDSYYLYVDDAMT